MESASRFRDGAVKGLESAASLARRVASQAVEGGASPDSVVRMVSQNLDRHARSDGRRAKGVQKACQRPMSSGKRTGKSVNRAKVAQSQAADAADLISRYRKIRAIVERNASCNNRATRKRAKGALKLASRVYSEGEIRHAIEILRAA